MHRAPRPRQSSSLYDDTIRAIYALEPQDLAVGHLGEASPSRARFESNTIHVTSIKVLTDRLARRPEGSGILGSRSVRP